VEFFPNPTSFRDWLIANHRRATEALVGFHKRATDEPSLTWEQGTIVGPRKL